MVRELPFTEKLISSGSTDTVYRTFRSDIETDELKWHWDEEDRTIHLIGETDWMFQRDNQLPEPIKPMFKIKSGEWHRIIKGTGDLRLIVEKHRDI